MLKVFVLLLVLGFAKSKPGVFDTDGFYANRKAAVPLGMSVGAGELDVEGICMQYGTACENCTHSVTCVRLTFGWLKVPLEECSEGFSCNSHLGGCAKDPVPECHERAMEFNHYCEQVGSFPDAHDCRKYHVCTPHNGEPDGGPAEHRTVLCPRNYGYDPRTAQCSVQLTHGQCKQKPVPDCTAVGQHGVLPSSSNFYYVCLGKDGILHPQIFSCPNGWHFWEDFCNPEPETKTEDNNTCTTEISTNSFQLPSRSEDVLSPIEAVTSSYENKPSSPEDVTSSYANEPNDSYYALLEKYNAQMKKYVEQTEIYQKQLKEYKTLIKEYQAITKVRSSEVVITTEKELSTSQEETTISADELSTTEKDLSISEKLLSSAEDLTSTVRGLSISEEESISTTTTDNIYDIWGIYDEDSGLTDFQIDNTDIDLYDLEKMFVD